ncbi:MAG: Co/Zn/Cd efflux system rane fusion protein [Chitinophagaceae bacterium]|nr:Co/Zn/Cd efflux system rane fusion protein [Chitinophagaceae bacterium]
MKKGWLFILAGLVAIIALYFLVYHNSEEKSDVAKLQALSVNKNTGPFNQSFDSMMNAYYQLHDAFVNWDTAAVSQLSNALAAAITRLPVDQVKGDSAIVITARSLAETAAGESEAIAAEPGIEEKRRSFYTLSEGLYNLARTVKYDGGIIYHVNCPMAFNDDEEAFWLSRENKVVNPYLGTKHPKYKNAMLNCGEVKDSIDFTKK